jgi:regulator of sigma E protease
MSILLLVIGLILFVCLVIVHEFGHYIAAKRNGVDVEEFGIGFPPRVLKKKLKNKTLLTINALPLGGFVKLKGEHDADTEPGSYGAASLGAKTKIISAGVVMNLLVAWLLFTLVALIGMPRIIDNQFTVKSDTTISKQKVLVAYVEPKSPAESAGLKPSDELKAITSDGQSYTIKTVNELPQVTDKFAGKEVTISYIHDGQLHETKATLRSDQETKASKDTDQPKGHLGISPAEYQLRRSTWSAPVVALGTMAQFTELTYKGIWTALSSLFHGDTTTASSQVSGPVGVYFILKDGSLLGVQFMLMIVGVISLTLAIMNILPIPALDGGRLFVTYLFRAMKKPLEAKTEELIHGIGFAVLMLLFVVITVVDIRRFF